MNKREEQKINTRLKILETAKKEFIKNGFLKTSTENIAKKAGVAHGTLFLHFQNKENFIIEIFDIELKLITDELHSLLKEEFDLKKLLVKYLDFIERDEIFFATIAKEFPFYPPKLKRQIIFRESAIRNYFYMAIQNGVKEGVYKNINVTDVIIFLFATINYYLCNDESFIEKGSVINKKKYQIVNTFLKLLLKENL